MPRRGRRRADVEYGTTVSEGLSKRDDVEEETRGGDVEEGQRRGWDNVEEGMSKRRVRGYVEAGTRNTGRRLMGGRGGYAEERRTSEDGTCKTVGV